MELVTLCHLLRTNKTVRAGSNRIDYLYCLPSDFRLRRVGEFDSDDLIPDCGDWGWGSTLELVISLPPFREFFSCERSFRNAIRFLGQVQERGDNNPAGGPYLICNPSAK